MLRREPLLLPWLFPFHCWLMFLSRCAQVLSVAGFPAVSRYFPVSLLGLFPLPFPFHCWTTVNTRFTVGHTLGPGRLIPHNGQHS